MASAARCLLSLMLLLLGMTVTRTVHVKSSEDDFVKCESGVKKWAASSLDEQVKKDKHTLQDLLFFLHVPRTGGRTYFHCFLRKLYSTYLECPRSYDKLRFDPSKPNCRLMVTHDDYSMMSRLPDEKTSVVTILRKPVDRVLSTYEFSVEVAARFLVHPNLTSATQMTGRIRPKSNGVSTLDIWPWKYLVPWMREDLFSRREGRKRGEFNDFKESNDPYNIQGIVMPLHEFINDPVAHEIIHNGATFQVAGLTNNSCLAEAHEVRQCVRKYRSLGGYVLDVAKKRLDDMLYVGLTEDHKGSATMFANVVGGQVLSQLHALSSNIKKAAYNETDMSSSLEDTDHDTDHLQNSTKDEKGKRLSSTGNAETINETMTVGDLMNSYEVCISSLRKAQARRRTASLKRVAPANFSKEARLQISEVVLQNIISLNSLDVELYKHAKYIFAQQGKRLTEKLFEAGGPKLLTDGGQGQSVVKFSTSSTPSKLLFG
ncbi:hypothetical protein IFM89_009426 [Coptis chinensis]|uniref:Protein-tyrosine sulfotransferase n=1 Tax=Coptis chinensis TaxID=261450 RepID=A0A835LZR9_9MAGN|nr:hypothetical protein IFM89_009426 [Coptis chinensis]